VGIPSPARSLRSRIACSMLREIWTEVVPLMYVCAVTKRSLY